MGLAYQKFATECVLQRTRKTGAAAEMAAVFLRDAMARV
jgi:hypothetical protein